MDDEDEQVTIREQPRIINTQDRETNIKQQEKNGGGRVADRLQLERETPDSELWNENKQYQTREKYRRQTRRQGGKQDGGTICIRDSERMEE